MTDHTRSTLAQLLGSISDDLRTLGAQTLGLARLEMRTAAGALLSSVIGVAVSAFVAIAGAGVLVSALVLAGVALGLPAWAAATLVGLGLTGGGTLLVRHFVQKARSVELTLRETRASVGETIEWIKTQAS